VHVYVHVHVRVLEALQVCTPLFTKTCFRTFLYFKFFSLSLHMKKKRLCCI